LEEYLGQSGFYQYFRLPRSDHIVRASTVQLKRMDAYDPIFVENVLAILSNNISMSRGVQYSLHMSLQETMTNAFDHSGSPLGCFACAQVYPVTGKIRVCIVDFGIGIKNSLWQRPEYKKEYRDDYQAIRGALIEGVSTRKRTAGMGLPHIQRFLRVNDGKMAIISGAGKVFWKHDQKKILNQPMPTPFQGTIIKLEINADKEGFYMLNSEMELFGEEE